MSDPFAKIFYSMRYSLSVGLAVSIALVVHHYFSFSNEPWIILSAFLVSQTTRGTPFRQGLNLFLGILSALLFTSFLLMHSHETLNIYLLASVFVLVGFGLFLQGLPLTRSVYPIFCFLLVTLFSALDPPNTTQFMHDRILDTLMGVVIGILTTRFVLFTRFDKEFRQGLIPLLGTLIPYSQALMESFLHPEANLHVLNEKKIEVEKSLESQQGHYPEWVYEVGFNPGLRSGFRFFLITLERIVELFFSMNYLVSRHTEIATKLDQDTKLLADAIAIAMNKNQELLTILSRYLAYDKIEKTDSDFTSDIAQLETTLRQVVPNNLELLDISPGYILLTAFVRDLKDMRGLLLQLVMALPATSSVKH